MTWPPTSSGSHVERGPRSQSWQLNNGVRAGSSRWVRPKRSAKHVRGSAPGSRVASALPGAIAVAASKRFSLLLLREHDDFAARQAALEMPLHQ